MINTERAQTAIKEQLINVLDTLPFEKMQQLLEFAAFLKERSNSSSDFRQNALDAWEESLCRSEAFWFGLPASVRKTYAGKVVALLNEQIIDSDTQLNRLKRRTNQKFSDQPVLYIEAEAEALPPIIIHTPRFG